MHRIKKLKFEAAEKEFKWLLLSNGTVERANIKRIRYMVDMETSIDAKLKWLFRSKQTVLTVSITYHKRLQLQLSSI